MRVELVVLVWYGRHAYLCLSLLIFATYVCLCLLPQACSSLRPNLGVPNGHPNWWKAEGSTKSQPRSGQLLVLATCVGCVLKRSC